MEKPRLIIDRLSKKYPGSKSYSLRNVSLSISPGEVYGFLGANGAGKTTTIRTLLNFIQPTGGSATICGLDIVLDSVAVKKRIGYLPGEVALYNKMTGLAFLQYMSALQPLKHRAYVEELLDRFQVETDKPIHELSKGNRQKLGIIQAFMHEPEVLILDEPTSGLDPLMQEEFFALLRESQKRGASIFMSSHNFSEVQRVCDHVGFLRNGELIIEQSIADLEEKASHTFRIVFNGEIPLREFANLKKAKIIGHDKNQVVLRVEGELKPLFGILARYHVVRFEQQAIDLENEFLHFYKGKEPAK